MAVAYCCNENCFHRCNAADKNVLYVTSLSYGACSNILLDCLIIMKYLTNAQTIEVYATLHSVILVEPK